MSPKFRRRWPLPGSRRQSRDWRYCPSRRARNRRAASLGQGPRGASRPPGRPAPNCITQPRSAGGLTKDTPIAIYCAKGGRAPASRRPVGYGLHQVFNIGGFEDCAQQVVRSRIDLGLGNAGLPPGAKAAPRPPCCEIGLNKKARAQHRARAFIIQSWGGRRGLPLREVRAEAHAYLTYAARDRKRREPLHASFPRGSDAEDGVHQVFLGGSSVRPMT